MKTTLWVQISQRFTDAQGTHETMEVKAFDGDTWSEAFQNATADYFADGAYFIANESVEWFMMQIVNKNCAVEQNMRMEWTRPITEE